MGWEGHLRCIQPTPQQNMPYINGTTGLEPAWPHGRPAPRVAQPNLKQCVTIWWLQQPTGPNCHTITVNTTKKFVLVRILKTNDHFLEVGGFETITSACLFSSTTVGPWSLTLIFLPGKFYINSFAQCMRGKEDAAWKSRHDFLINLLQVEPWTWEKHKRNHDWAKFLWGWNFASVQIGQNLCRSYTS